MDLRVVGLYILLGSAAPSESFLTTIRPKTSVSVFRALDGNIEVAGSSRGSSVFRAETKKRRLPNLFRAWNRNRMAISPENDSSLYLGYDKPMGLRLGKKKTYWKYKTDGGSEYMFMMGGKCLTWLDGNNFNMSRCNRADERQVFLLERQQALDESTAEEESKSPRASRTSADVDVDGPEEDSDTSSDSSSSSDVSNNTVVRPIFINLNLRGTSPVSGDPKTVDSSKPTSSSNTTAATTATPQSPGGSTSTLRIETVTKSVSTPPTRKKSTRRRTVRNEDSSSSGISMPKSSKILSNMLCDDLQEWDSEYEQGLGDDIGTYSELDRLFGGLGQHYMRTIMAPVRFENPTLGTPSHPPTGTATW